MKILKKIVSLFLPFVCFTAIASNNWSLEINKWKEANITFDFNNWHFQADTINGKAVLRVITPQQLYTFQKSAPQLPFFATAVWNTAPDSLLWQIIDSSFTDYQNVLVPPSAGLHKTNTSDSLVFGALYQQNVFWPKQLIGLGSKYSQANIVGHGLRCFPVQYNGATKTLRVYNRIVARCNGFATEAFPTQNQNSEFCEMGKQHFLNGKIKDRLKKLSSISDRGKMLIVCPPQFAEIIKPFVSWKQEKGIVCEIIDASKFLGAEALKKEIKRQCSNAAFAYLLLVGDNGQVPTNTSILLQHGSSDAEYGYLTQRDFYPDLMIGRFSGHSIAQIETQIRRTIDYERNITESDEWLARYLLLASGEYTMGDNGEMDFEHLRTLGDSLKKQTYTSGFFLHDDTAGTKITNSQFIDSLNKGAGLFFYTGHGETTLLRTSNFSVADTAKLQNTTLPFSVIAGCKVGNFADTTCLAEALMRATWQKQAVGSIAIAASSTEQDWNPPMFMQDKFVELMKTNTRSNGLHSIGSLMLASCYAMNDAYQNSSWENTDTWILFGDPSLSIRTAIPHKMTINAAKSISLSDEFISISCNDSLATATITQNNQLLGVASVENGKITFSVRITSLAPIVATITAPNAVAWQDTIKITKPSSDYLVIDKVLAYNQQQTESKTVHYNETISVAFQISNLGQSASAARTLSITATNAEVLKPDFFVDAVDADKQILIKNAFSLKFQSTIEDSTLVLLTIKDKDQILANCTLLVRAPQLKIGKLRFAPTIASNGDSTADAGEVDSVFVEIINTGIFSIENIDLQAKTNREASLLHQFQLIATLAAGQSVWAKNEILFAANKNSWQKAIIDFTVQSATTKLTAQREIPLSNKVETWEDSTFTQIDWQNKSNTPWQIQKSGFDGFAARSGKIGDDDSTVLSLKVNFSRKDTLSFWFKTSCEEATGTTIFDTEYFDFLQFSIDGRNYHWAGVNDWQLFTLPIGAGTYTATWKYEKDLSNSYYEDAVWIDNIKIEAPNNELSRVTNATDTLALFSQPFTWQPRFSATPDVFAFYRKPAWLNESNNSLSGTCPATSTIDTIITYTRLNSHYLAQLFRIERTNNSANNLNENLLIVNVFPNPASSNISIESNQVITNLNIISVQSEVLRSKLGDGKSKIELNIKELANGLYFLQIHTENGSSLLRFIKGE